MEESPQNYSLGGTLRGKGWEATGLSNEGKRKTVVITVRDLIETKRKKQYSKQ